MLMRCLQIGFIAKKPSSMVSSSYHLALDVDPTISIVNPNYRPYHSHRAASRRMTNATLRVHGSSSPPSVLCLLSNPLQRVMNVQQQQHQPWRLRYMTRMNKRYLYTFTPYTGSNSSVPSGHAIVRGDAIKGSAAEQPKKPQYNDDDDGQQSEHFIIDEIMDDNGQCAWMKSMNWTWNPTQPSDIGLRQCINLARQQSLSASLCAIYYLTERMEAFFAQPSSRDPMGPVDFVRNMMPPSKNGSPPAMECIILETLEHCFMMMRHAEERGADYTTSWINRTNWLWVENMQDIALLQCIDLARRDGLYSFLKATSKMIRAIRIQDARKKSDAEKLQQFKAAITSLYSLARKWEL